MELAYQMEERGVKLIAEWAPRELNSAADALTNGVHEGCSTAMRLVLDPGRLPLLVLPALMKEAQVFYDQVKAKRSARRTSGTSSSARYVLPKAVRALRESEPW
jgi:hypothetical protein